MTATSSEAFAEALARRFREHFAADDFSRLDEGDDAAFYEEERLVQHLDGVALKAVESIIGQLVVEEDALVLDLMASWDSHLPEALGAGRVVGLGLNGRELAANARLDERIVHDLNREPRLPFADASFDVVLNTVSVDYLTRPLDVFAEVGRVLRPGGLFLVLFSTRYFEPKVVKVWREASEEERAILVEEYFRHSRAFGRTETFVVKGLPRPDDDRYAGLVPTCDPVYAVYAERRRPGVAPAPPRRPRLEVPLLGQVDAEELAARTARVGETLSCPHCGQRLAKVMVPPSPFQEWENEHIYLCFNDFCPYVVRSWATHYRSGQRGYTSRFMYEPLHGRSGPLPVPSLRLLRDAVVEGG